jgi:hypothetical protein
VREDDEHPETILYGNLTLPRRASPRWYHEGIAVFLETWMAGGLGRAQGPYDEMVFRAMVRDSAHFYDPLGLEAEGTKVDFQVGTNSYLYGTRFMSYLAWQYSPEKVMDWVARRPGSKRYFANQFQHVFGKSLSAGWSDWIAFEHDFERANLDSLRQHPTTRYHDLSTIALGSVSRAFVDSASQSLIAAVFRPGVVAHLASIPLNGGPPRVLQEIQGPTLYCVSSLAYDPETRRVFYTADNNEWRDLCVYDLARGRAHKLIKDARLGDLAWDRAHHELWAVRHFNGYSSIVHMSAPFTDWKLAATLPYGLDAYDLDVSPDGRTIAASFAEINGHQSLRLMDTAKLAAADTTSRALWEFGSAIPEGFVFSPDGSALYGSSYYTGVSNIFRYDLARDSMEVLSNAETGFFRPVPTGEDSLIVFRYSGQGFTPARIAQTSLSDVSAITFLGAQLYDRYPVLKTWKVPPPSRVVLDSVRSAPHDYHAMKAVRLTTVVPIVESYRQHTSVGWDAELSDPLGMNRFSVSATVSPERDMPERERVHVTARYHRYDLGLSFRWNPASFYDLAGPTQVSRKGFNSAIDYHRMLLRDVPRTLELTLRADHWGGLDHLPDQQNVSTSADFDQLFSTSAELRYKNTRGSLGSVDPEVGHTWFFSLSQNDVRFRTLGASSWKSYPFAEAGLDAGHPVPGFAHSSLWLRSSAGIASHDPAQPFANFYFGAFGNNVLDHQDPKRYRSPESFPGLPIDEVSGTNYARTMLDWNLPALRFRRAGTLALYASWARVSLFSSALATNLGDAALRRKVGDAGAQVDFRLQLLTQNPLTLSFGYARAFEKDTAPRSEWMASLKVL